jgi:small-conductance mechanosensitive channel
MNPLIIAAIIAGGGIFLGIIFDRIVLALLKSVAKRTKWEGDLILVKSLNGMLILWFTLVGFYFALRYVELSEFWQEHIRKTLLVMAILSVTVFAAKTIKGYVKLNTQKVSHRIPAVSIFTAVINIFVYAIGFLIILQSLGISITPILTALGVGGLAVALALQDTLSNLFAGFHILASKKIRPGDFVKLENGETGFITDINWRLTSIQSGDHLVLIPNSKLASSVLLNYSLPDMKVSVSVPLSVTYQSDLKKVEEIMLSAAKETIKEIPEFTNDEPVLRFTNFSESGIQFEVVLKVKEYNKQAKARSEFIKRLHEKYLTHGIDPFHTRTVITKSA